MRLRRSLPPRPFDPHWTPSEAGIDRAPPYGVTDSDRIGVSCDAIEGGWRCTVVVGDDGDATEHLVEVDRATLDDLAPGATPDVLVRESFRYLLEREPRESIMRSFELPIIARFFGEYPDEISRRLGGEPPPETPAGEPADSSFGPARR